MEIVYRVSIAMFWIWLKLMHSLKIYGQENFPEDAGYIVASNHASLIDPPVIGAVNPHWLIFMAKKELFEGKRWGWWFHACGCISISRNKKDHSATKAAIRTLKEGMSVAIFPEGTRNEDSDLEQAEMGVAFLSAKSGAKVIPVYIEGSQNAISKEFGYKPWTPISVYIGTPVDFSGADNVDERREKLGFMTKRIMASIRALRARALADAKKAQ